MYQWLPCKRLRNVHFIMESVELKGTVVTGTFWILGIQQSTKHKNACTAEAFEGRG